MRTKCQSVLVGVDGSANSDAALSLAAWEADRRRGELLIAHGYRPQVPYATIGFAPYPVNVASPLAEMRELLANTAERVLQVYPKLAVRTALVAGSAAGALVELSRSTDLVVVGSRGVGGFTGLLAGSVATQLAAHSHAPTIVVRPPHAATSLADPPIGGPVMVGVDGTPETTDVVGFAFDEASARGVPLIAIYAWWMLPTHNLGPTTLRHYDEREAEEEARRLLAESVAGWADKYPDVPLEQRATFSANPAAEMLDLTEDAGLLVVGTHGGNAVTRLVIGSVSDTLVRHAACPVAVVPAPVTADI
jgi:nucleotide-binding universal stress UspA family protein